MAVKFEKIKEGDVLYDRHTYRMGNTTVRCIGEWEVKIYRLDSDQKGAFVSWNGNSEQYYTRSALEKLYTWSMYDPGVIRYTNFLGGVTKVLRAPKNAPGGKGP